VEELSPRRERRWRWAVALAIALACFLQEPGRLVADTKLDLLVDPARFLGQALKLWEPLGSFGQIQNQSVGYLFPMGPFFTAADWSGLPMWMAQRAWMSLLLITAFVGVARVAEELRMGSSGARLAAGAAYALSPLFLEKLAFSSAGLLPSALVPWAILPLIRASRGGSTVKGAAASGLAVLGMGGVNAVSTLGALPLPALWIATRSRGPRRRSLAFWWVVAVGLATLWWVLPLLLQGRYGLPFVRYTETAATTTAGASAVEALRGTPNWLSYLHLGDAWVPSGWALVSVPAAIIGTAALAASGLAGLALRSLPQRAFLLAALTLGLVLTSAAYSGPLGGALAGPLGELLAGPLGGFRNVHKFEPVLRLPLALGLAHLLATVPAGRWRAAVGVLAVLGILAASAPLLRGELAPHGSFREVPSHWTELASYLERQPDGGRALLLPASAFGEYAWGRPLDEPLQPLASRPWAVRSLVPLGGTGSTRMLDAIERRIETGVPSPGLRELLSRAGVRYVVARHDLDWRRANAPRPLEVHLALRAAGLKRVASFGPLLPPGRVTESYIDDLGLPRYEARLPSIEVFDAGGPAPLVTSYPRDSTLRVSGGPESLLALADRGALGGRAALTGPDAVRGSEGGAAWAVTDSARRRDLDFGIVHDNFSYTLTRTARPPGREEGPQQFEQVAPRHQAVAELSGAREVSASSYGSWLIQVPELSPEAALDGDPATAWVAGTSGSSEGEWIEVVFERPRRVSGLAVRLLRDGPLRPRVTRLEVITDAGRAVTALRPGEAAQRLRAPAGSTSRLRLRIAGVREESAGSPGAGVRDLLVPGLAVERSLVVPQEPRLLELSTAPGGAPLFAFDRAIVNSSNILRSDEEPTLVRSFELRGAARYRVRGIVLPRGGRPLDRLLSPRGGLQVWASSTWNDLPRYRASRLADGRARSAWVAGPPLAAPGTVRSQPGARALRMQRDQPEEITPIPVTVDPHPRLRLRWPGVRRLGSLRVSFTRSFPARPLRIRLAAGGEERVVDVPRSGRIRFEPLRTDRLELTFPRVARRLTSGGALSGRRVPLPVGIAELDFPALRDLRRRPPRGDTPFRLPCGEGPPVEVDGRRLPTAVRGIYADLETVRPLELRVCPAHGVRLGPGRHLLRASAGETFTPTSLTLAPSGWPAPGAGARDVSVRRWSAEHREVRIGGGPAAYLVVRENFNRGWSARLNGRELRPVRIDGWQQGFEVPAGAGGLVTVEFAPGRTYRAALLAGALAVVLLLALALLPLGRRTRSLPPLGELRLRRHHAVALALAALLLLGGVLVLALTPLIWLGRWRPAWLPALAAAAMLMAGLVVALEPGSAPGSGVGAFGPESQLLAVLAIGATLASHARPAVRRLRRTSA
jgi:arabinofuranan 3-O-arabinosyltransferase